MATIALLVTDDAQHSEPRTLAARFEMAGHALTPITGDGERREAGPAPGGAPVAVTALYPDDFQALVIPDGSAVERFRLDEALVTFVRACMAKRLLVGASGHGVQLLIETEAIRGRAVTAPPAIQTDVKNAGAMWVDEPVVEDDDLITAQDPDAFCAAFLARLAQLPGRSRPGSA